MPMMLTLMPTMLKGKDNDATMPPKVKPMAGRKPANKIFVHLDKMAPNGTTNCYLDCRFVIFNLNLPPANMPQPTHTLSPFSPMPPKATKIWEQADKDHIAGLINKDQTVLTDTSLPIIQSNW